MVALHDIHVAEWRDWTIPSSSLIADQLQSYDRISYYWET